MKRLFWTGLILAFAAAGPAQNLVVGGMYGIGSVSTEEKNVENQDLEFMEAFAGMFIEETTVLQLRAGRMNPRQEEPVQLDLDYVACTVSYMFETPVGLQGFYAGPSYYTGDILYTASHTGGEPRSEEVGKLGATGGVEGFFPLSQTLQFYGQISGHYIPIEDQQITFEVGLGFLVRF